MSVITADQYAVLVKAFAGQGKDINFAAAARAAHCDQRSAQRVYRKGLRHRHGQPALPPVEVAIEQLTGGGIKPEAVPDTLRVLANATATLMETSDPYLRALEGAAPTIRAKVEALPAAEAVGLFAELTKSVARCVFAAERLDSLRRAITWEREAPAREAAEAATREGERLRIAALPQGHWEKPWDPL